MQTLMAKAQAQGLTLVELSGRVEVRKGAKVLSFDTRPDRALQKAFERIDENRLRELDKRASDREPVLKVRPKPVVVSTEQLVALVKAEPSPIVVEVVEPPVPISKSIVKPQYRERYKKNGYSCGDDIAVELREYVVVREGGRLVTDEIKLRQVAVDNGIWVERYASLNVGCRRMTIGNRLRNKRAQGDAIDIGGAIYQIEIK